jgi:hypothetical protein
MHRRVIVGSVLVFGLLAGEASAQSFNWLPDEAEFKGKCVRGRTAFAIAAGEDLSIVFSDMGDSLPAQSGRKLRINEGCRIKVPAVLEGGFYLGEFTQTVTYGFIKTAGSEATVKFKSKFFHQHVADILVELKHGVSGSVPLDFVSRSDLFTRHGAVWPGWCRRRDRRGNFVTDLDVKGRRDSDNETLIVFVDGMDLRFQIAPRSTRC